jgi:hypothetical protein
MSDNASETVAVTQADGDLAASIRANLYRSCPDMPSYPVGIVEQVIANHRTVPQMENGERT